MQRSISLLRTIVLPILGLSLMTGCGESASKQDSGPKQGPSALSDSAKVATPSAPRASVKELSVGQNQLIKVADQPSTTVPAMPDERKIIRNGEFTIDTDNPAEGQRKIASIAEGHGGFVVKSEISQSDSSNGTDNPRSTVSLVIRVPAAHFGAAVDEIRGIGKRVAQEKITGEDVTEQYIDLEARIKTKKALEAQFIEILKQAHNVRDALEVQTQVAEVRTEIEQLEGKRRFLENQSALSTITVTLRPPTPIVAANPTGILASIRESFGDGADLAVTIILGLVRFIILAIPVFVLILLPLGLIGKFIFSKAIFKMNLFGKAKDDTEIEQH